MADHRYTIATPPPLQASRTGARRLALGPFPGGARPRPAGPPRSPEPWNPGSGYRRVARRTTISLPVLYLSLPARAFLALPKPGVLTAPPFYSTTNIPYLTFFNADSIFSTVADWRFLFCLIHTTKCSISSSSNGSLSVHPVFFRHRSRWR